MSKDKYAHLLVKRYQYWSVYLHENQCYLGRCYIWLHREGDISLTDIRFAERNELFDIYCMLEDALKASGLLWGAERANFSYLANTTPHCHVHIVPRYAGQRVFMGIVFKDTMRGKNYAPYRRKFTIPDEVTQEIRKLLKQALKK